MMYDIYYAEYDTLCSMLFSSENDVLVYSHCNIVIEVHSAMLSCDSDVLILCSVGCGMSDV